MVVNCSCSANFAYEALQLINICFPNNYQHRHFEKLKPFDIAYVFNNNQKTIYLPNYFYSTIISTYIVQAMQSTKLYKFLKMSTVNVY